MARSGRSRRVLLLAGLVTGLAAAAAPTPSAAGAPPSDPRVSGAGREGVAERGQVRVLVREHAGQGAAAQAAVRRLGGHVTTPLPLVDGFAATVPASALPALSSAPGVEAVAPDALVTVSGAPDLDGRTGEEPERPLAPDVVRAPAAWAAGVTGRDVTVALLDTGISATPDLDGRVVPVDSGLLGPDAPCYDLSGERTCRDTYGHGTFMAGLIAGDGSGKDGRDVGVAPGARLVSVKVAGRSGASDVSTVLAGIQWVVSHKDVYGIDVLNLSLGTGSTTSWRYDPLNYAVERAWHAGIAVVTAASNRGPRPGSVSKPGDDPWVITVGATDSVGTVALGDDRVPDFSARGPAPEGVGKPDLVAPGARVLSLQADQSTLQRTYPSALPGRYRLGSGTSMATAVVSGAAALVLERNPGMSPDRLKHVLRSTARPVGATRDPAVVGAGVVDAYTAALRPPDGVANAGLDRSNGRGELGASRGPQEVRADGLVPLLLQGRMTAQALVWEVDEYVRPDWTPASWTASAHGLLGWNTLSWAGAEGEGHDWVGHDWVGHDWVGSSWQGQQEERTEYGRTGRGSASYGAWG